MNERYISLAEHNIDTILYCLCEQIRSQQFLIDAHRSTQARLESEIKALKMKYEGLTPDPEEDIYE